MSNFQPQFPSLVSSRSSVCLVFAFVVFLKLVEVRWDQLGDFRCSRFVSCHSFCSKKRKKPKRPPTRFLRALRVIADRTLQPPRVEPHAFRRSPKVICSTRVLPKAGAFTYSFT